MMLGDLARAYLKENLIKCTLPQQDIFKRMYSHDNLELPIDQVVDKIPETKLDWAIQQVDRTLEKNANANV